MIGTLLQKKTQLDESTQPTVQQNASKGSQANQSLLFLAPGLTACSSECLTQTGYWQIFSLIIATFSLDFRFAGMIWKFKYPHLAF